MRRKFRILNCFSVKIDEKTFVQCSIKDASTFSQQHSCNFSFVEIASNSSTAASNWISYEENQTRGKSRIFYFPLHSLTDTKETHPLTSQYATKLKRRLFDSQHEVKLENVAQSKKFVDSKNRVNC
ncbi:hypothetical protein CAEBREN_14098 [Caenorhabditis brenneri]|uniref:Uncharacterized protein n=1 Tax=Caenorhabditis brenneri TaxID=135651 RepID=G0MQN5_CAEBE|nr:hypothetical protein CAEBREN_14098 [Caenorhabditis brenneri]